MASSTKLIGSVEACTTLAINRSTLTRWVQLGKITPVMRLPGSRGPMLFDPADVEKCRRQIVADEERAAARRERRSQLMKELAELSDKS